MLAAIESVLAAIKSMLAAIKKCKSIKEFHKAVGSYL